VNFLTHNLTLLYGFPFPRFLKGGRSVLSGALERKVRSAIGTPDAAKPDLWRDYSAELARFLGACGARSVLAETGTMGAFVHAACERGKLPYVVHFHGVDAYGRELLAESRSHYHAFFKRAASLVVVSRAMRAQLIGLGAPAGSIVLAPYGVDVDPPQVADPAHAGPCFVAVGRFVEKKAPHLTLQAFAAVLRQLPEARLVMVGDGPLLAVCRRWAEDNGIAGAVTFAGARSRAEVSRHMALSRVFVQHSLTASNGDSEGLPLAVLEAGAHGLPVVSTRHAGIPDAVRNGMDGLLVAERDVSAMAAAMLRLALDPGLSARLGASFRARVAAKYSREHSIRRLRGILQAAADGLPGRELGEAPNDGGDQPEVPVTDAAAVETAQAAPSGYEAVPGLLGAITRDRGAPGAYLELGRLLLRNSHLGEAYVALGEAFRLSRGDPAIRGLLGQLEGRGALGLPVVETYRSRAGWLPLRRAARPRRILVVTNLLPPQEMGGFGRTMWEFSRELAARGHTVRVLTADMPHLLRKPSAEHQDFEANVSRTLRLWGDWKKGVVEFEADPARRRRVENFNERALMAATEEFRPDAVMAGNLDLMGVRFLQRALDRGVPVLHRLGNALPGYEPALTPRSTLYCLAGCSEWVNQNLRAAGYPIENFAVLPPGSPLDDYFLAFPPQRARLRIAFAGLLMPYKGGHVLVEALAYLRRVGIDFECCLAGDSTAPDYVDRMRALAGGQGFADRLHFPGFLGKTELAALYARCNVLVFPSIFQEPFGKTQVEAMAAGLVVVSSDGGGVREVLRDGETGLLFKSGDACDLAEKLARVHRNPAFAQKMADAGQADAFRFTTGASVDRLEGLLEGLISAAGSRPAREARRSA
jgi:glycosyltransferase involved in cell wall biosynthesis